MMFCKIGLHSWKEYQKSSNDILLSRICTRCKKVKVTKAMKNLRRSNI